MKIDPKGLSREPSSCLAGASRMAGYKSVKETLRVWNSEHVIVESNRELIRLYEEKVMKVIERVWEG